MTKKAEAKEKNTVTAKAQVVEITAFDFDGDKLRIIKDDPGPDMFYIDIEGGGGTATARFKKAEFIQLANLMREMAGEL